jgi:putative tricarboxylic transport membrane protein
MNDLIQATGDLFAFIPLLFLFIGVLLGIVGGALPGITGAMMIALCLPLTFTMEPTNALTLLISIYVGAISGGLITATLMRMPGTPAAVMTTLDGYPLAQSGQPGRALGLSITASFVGGLVSFIFLVLLSRPLSEFASRFGPYELFSLVMMALVLMASVSQGSMLKGLLSGFLGMVVAIPGTDPSTGFPRLTFGVTEMNSGFGMLPVLIGVYCISQLLKDIVEIGRKPVSSKASKTGIFMKLKDWKDQAVNLIRSSLIGTWIGILPGIGANIGSVVAYSAAQKMSKTPEKFGKGSEEGIVASEAANNATVGGALIPLIAMGIPGSVIDAILIGALMIHGITPGPLLFKQEPQLVYGMMSAYFVANIVMFVLMILLAARIAKLMFINRAWILPPITVLCILGAYATSNSFFSVWVMFAFGVLGYCLDRWGVPLGPFVIGFVLAPIAETKLRSGLGIHRGDITPLFSSPLSLTFLILAAVLLFWPILKPLRRKINDKLRKTASPS